MKQFIPVLFLALLLVLSCSEENTFLGPDSHHHGHKHKKHSHKHKTSPTGLEHCDFFDNCDLPIDTIIIG